MLSQFKIFDKEKKINWKLANLYSEKPSLKHFTWNK